MPIAASISLFGSLYGFMQKVILLVLWRTDLLLGRDLEANNGRQPLLCNSAVNTPLQQ
jgi:hypothetical protein